MEKGTILILGAGHAQIDAISHCKNRGYRVIGCSNRGTDPGIALLDDYKEIDICDIDGICAYASEEGASAIYSVGSDLAVPSFAIASERLGLPSFVSPETAWLCHDKGKMRAALSSTPWGVPYRVVSSESQLDGFGGYPAMLKPADSQGQRGCFRVEDAKDAHRHFECAMQFSRSCRVIVERYVDGPEISVNAFVRDGKVELMLPSDRHSHGGVPGGIIKEHVLPCSSLSEAGYAQVERLVSDVVQTLKILNGPVYFQIKMDGDIPRLLEVTPRLDGCHLWRLVKRCYGYDLLARTFDLLLGEKTAEDACGRPADPGTWTLSFMSEPPGAVFDRGRYDVGVADYVYWYYETGDVVMRSNGLLEKCGYAITRTE